MSITDVGAARVVRGGLRRLNARVNECPLGDVVESVCKHDPDVVLLGSGPGLYSALARLRRRAAEAQISLCLTSSDGTARHLAGLARAGLDDIIFVDAPDLPLILESALARKLRHSVPVKLSVRGGGRRASGPLARAERVSVHSPVGRCQLVLCRPRHRQSMAPQSWLSCAPPCDPSREAHARRPRCRAERIFRCDHRQTAGVFIVSRSGNVCAALMLCLVW